jgi:hypothetical protein
MPLGTDIISAFVFLLFSSNLSRLIVDGLPAIKAGRGEWQAAARTQLQRLFFNFRLTIPGEVTYVRGLHTRDGLYKAEVGLSSVDAALAIRKKFFSFVRPNNPDPMPEFLRGVSINPSFTDGSRVRVAILKVCGLLFGSSLCRFC